MLKIHLLHSNCPPVRFAALFAFVIVTWVMPARLHSQSASVAAMAPYSRVTDLVDFSSSASRGSHAVRGNNVTFRRVLVETGAMQVELAGGFIQPGGFVSWKLKIPSLTRTAASITLGVTPRSYGKFLNYSLRLEGKELYHFEGHDPGGGPTSTLFFELPPLAGTANVSLHFEETSQCEITLLSSRLYPSGTGGFVTPPMGLCIVAAPGPDGNPDEKSLRSAMAMSPRSPRLNSEIGWDYPYMRGSLADHRSRMFQITSLAEKLQRPIRVCFRSDGIGSPARLPDGAGGTFGDLPYQQITFDPDDAVDEPGLSGLMGERYDRRFGITTTDSKARPPALTYNHPRLQRFHQVHLSQALSAWRDSRDRLALVGRGFLLPLGLTTGESTAYYARGVDDAAFTAINGGKPRAHLSADFNAYTVQDARQDGIELDPRDGLDERERGWLHRNLAREQQRTLLTLYSMLPPEPIRIQNGASFAKDLFRRNLFPEAVAGLHFPWEEQNRVHPGLEHSYVRYGRPGASYNSGSEVAPWITKQRDRGRTALTRLDWSTCTDDTAIAALRAAFAGGARFAVVDLLATRPNGSEALSRLAHELATVSVGTWNGVKPHVDYYQEVDFAAPPDSFAVNTIALTGSGVTPGTSFTATLSPLITSAGDTVTLRSTAAAVGTLRLTLPSLFPLKPGHKYHLRIDTHLVGGEHGPPVESIAIGCDLEMERARSFAVSLWRDTADQLDATRELLKTPEQTPQATKEYNRAEALLDKGMFVEAYAAAITAEQLALPSGFLVASPGGALGPYPITIRSQEGPIHCTIRALAADRVALTLRARMDLTATVVWNGKETRVRCSANLPLDIELHASVSRNRN